ncbi:aldehyde dehydrogenase family protein [Streptomyces sp. NPDC026672]|uniref:aldehyde dehydrogenase family protein n=1 Tax=unclassified Streptomyces TaxID=2593676 RepID=UPI0033E8AAD7
MTVSHTENSVVERGLFIGGTWRNASDGGHVTVHSPVDGRVVGRAATATPGDVADAVAAARGAFDRGPWPLLSHAERGEYLLRLAAELDRDVETAAHTVLGETGLSIHMARNNAEALSELLRHYVDTTPSSALVEEREGTSGVRALVEKVPVGVVAAIVPWNAPLRLAAFKVAPALLAGCTLVLKPSPETPLSIHFLADAAVRAGIPDGVINIVAADVEASRALVEHPDVDKISFTGSTAVGRSIAASAAGTFKRVTLELGGKSAVVVLDDAPLDRVVQDIASFLPLNNGAICAMPSRLLVSERRKDEVVSALVEALEKTVVGDPADPDTQLGPMINRRHYERVLGYIDAARAEGGHVVTVGSHPEGDTYGAYVRPTVITDVSADSAVAQEEIFAPVLTVLVYRDEDHAVDIANRSVFGLSGAVYGTDPERALSVARRIRTGTVNINHPLRFDPAVPCGGFKASGYGRELGPEGLHAYLETRSVFL